jgi:putative membrane protein
MYAALLAQRWGGGNHMGAGWWWVMGIGWLLFLAFIGLLAYLLLRHHTDPGESGRQQASAEQILAERLARGEIDEDEYRRRRDALRG